MSSDFVRPHPKKAAFELDARPQYSRYARRELTKDQLMLNLRHLEERHGLVGYLNWDFWRAADYVLPWERDEQVPGEPGQTAGQGGTR